MKALLTIALLAMTAPTAPTAGSSPAPQREGFSQRRARSVEEVGGRVTWPDGSPAEGARVRVVPSERTPDWYGADPDSGTVTNSQGSFRVELDREGPHTVVVMARDVGTGAGGRERARAPHRIAIEGAVAPGTLTLALELGPGTVARGRVVDDLGLPLKSFKVEASPDWKFEDPPRLLPQLSQSFEGEDGKFEFAGLDGGRYRFRCSARDYSSSAEVSFEPGGGEPLAFVCARPARLEGVVLDPSGAPFGGARLLLMPSDWSSGGGFAETRSRRDGRFRFKGLDAGVMTLTVESEEHGDSTPLEFTLQPGESRTDVTVQLTRGARIVGRLHSSESPLAGREVVLSRLDGPSWASTATDSSGAFEFSGLSAGNYAVLLSPPKEPDPGGVVRDVNLDMVLTGGRSAAARREVSLVEGEVLELVLGGPASGKFQVSGVVVEGGEPRGGVELVCRRPGDTWDVPAVATATSGGEGAYELFLEEPGFYVLQVMQGSGVEFALPFVITGSPELVLEVAYPDGSLGGVVAGPDGPIATADVNLHLVQEGEAGIFDISRWTQTDARGRFDLKRLPEGTYTLTSFLDRRRSGTKPLSLTVLHHVRLGPGQRRMNLEIALVPGGTIEGVVLDASSTPVVGADVWLQDEHGVRLYPEGKVVTDAHGRFRASPIRPGVANLTATFDKRFGGWDSVQVTEAGTVQVELLLGD